MFLIIACTTDNVPPSPPPPGGGIAGRATIGVYINPTHLPDWAVTMKDAYITPITVNYGEDVTVTASNDYVYKYIYVLNKYGIWYRVSGIGSSVGDWLTENGEFKITALEEKLNEGPVYVLKYGCDIAGKDSQGKNIWN